MIKLLKTAVITLVIPIIAFFGSYLTLDASPGEIWSLVTSCAGDAFAETECGRGFRLSLVIVVAAISAGLSLALLLLFYVLGGLAGANRRLNAAIFPRLAPFTTLLIAILLLAQGASMSMAAFLGDFPRVIWAIVIGMLGLGALAGAGLMLWTLRLISKPAPNVTVGHLIERHESELLWNYVEGVARKLGAEPPDHLIVGLEPTFYATAAPVTTPDSGGVLHGRTMYLSMPLMRLFSEQELTSVVAHELGHFVGDDVDYSLRFAPAYRRMGLALQALSNEHGRARFLGATPAHAMLAFMFETFAKNERKISRLREFAADNVGVSAANPDALGLSLAKVAVYAPLWQKIRAENVERLNTGKISRNLSRVYADGARFDVSNKMIDQILDLVMKTKIAHPTDSHPTIAERYANIGFDEKTLSVDRLSEQGWASEPLFGDVGAFEEELTMLEHNVMVAIGAAEAPTESSEAGTVLQAAYLLAATMVTADGKVADQEIDIAEDIGRRLFDEFDDVSFREIVAHIDEMASFEHVVEVLTNVLDAKAKAVLHAYLGEIADSDAGVSREENVLLEHVVKTWGVDDPLWKKS